MRAPRIYETGVLRPSARALVRRLVPRRLGIVETANGALIASLRVTSAARLGLPDVWAGARAVEVLGHRRARGPAWEGAADSAPGLVSALEGVLDLVGGLLDPALGLAGASFSRHATVSGEAA